MILKSSASPSQFRVPGGIWRFQKICKGTVGGSEFLCSPVEVGSFSHYLQGFIHPRWFVWDFFHQQYVDSFHPFPNIHNFMTCSEPQGHGSQVFEWHRVMPKPPTNPVYTIVYIFIKTKCIVSYSIYI